MISLLKRCRHERFSLSNVSTQRVVYVIIINGNGMSARGGVNMEEFEIFEKFFLCIETIKKRWKFSSKKERVG